MPIFGVPAMTIALEDLDLIQRQVVFISLGDPVASARHRGKLARTARSLMHAERPTASDSRLEALRRYGVMYRVGRAAGAEGEKVYEAGFSERQIAQCEVL